MRALFGASLKMVVRDRQALFWALIFPIIFLGVFRLFSFDSFGTTDVLVSLDNPSSPSQQALLGALQSAEFLEVTVADQPLDRAGAETEIDDDNINAVLLVSSDGARVDASLIHGISDPIGSSATEAGISSIVDSVNLQLMGGNPPIAFVTERIDSAENTSFFEFLGPGIIGMGLMNFATISLAGSLSRYREEGVLRRIRATPLEPWKFFASVVLAHMTVAAMQVVVISVVAEALGANVFRGGPPFFILAVLGTVVFLNLGVIVAGLVHGRGAVEGAANAITLPMMFLSGTFFPTGSLPDVVRAAVQVLPLTHLLTAMRAFVDGDSVVSQWPHLLVLAAWIAGTFVVARFTFSLEDS
ncbi:MAG: ABC transporter permease [Dehalococcoidia bacterium]|nr:ABC transporter permease [Dehalococcoidia bacterium]MCA9849025.1 ABC transporter permease [Dehalococcoidia bacterium]MCA9856424.1 ABC transporter permease [Dehalococcoidia bacterium]MCB9490996.1 ABC transporter permease [Dehalococcoidia bacterium]